MMAAIQVQLSNDELILRWDFCVEVIIDAIVHDELEDIMGFIFANH